MANTHDLISSVTVGAGGTGQITFSSIPQTYTDLQLYFSVRSGASFTRRVLALTANNISNQYQDRYFTGNGSTTGSAQDVPTQSNMLIWDAPAATAASDIFSNISLYITNYSFSDRFKTVINQGVSEDNATAGINALLVGYYRQITPISELSFEVSGNFLQNSTAYLYGIKNS